MEDPNITMEEDIRLEEEKARRHGKVYNWETAMFGKILYDEDVHDLRSVETEFPAIVFNDELSSEKTLSCKPTVSSLNNNEIDFRISFGESDDEDYTVVFDKNSFSYKIIFADDLKTDSKNDNEKVNMPLFLSPEPKVSCFDDLDYFKDFEKEFPAIVYNDALTSKSEFLTEPTLCPQHIDEFDLKDETSLSEYNEEEQNILYFNDLFPFNIIYLGRCLHKDVEEAKVEGYTEEIVHDFEQRLKTIFRRQVNRVHILDFEGLTPDKRQDLAKRMRMVYTRDDGQEVFVSHAWRRLFDIRAPLVHEFILEFFSTFRIVDEMGLDADGTLCFYISGRGQAPEKVTTTDLFYLRSMDRGTANVLYLLAQYLFMHVEGRKSGARLSGEHFIGRLAHHFGLVSDDGLRGLSFVTCELPLIDMGELVKLNICIEIGDDWAWVAQGTERQPVATAAALGGAEDAPNIDKGAQAVLTPIHSPPPPPPATGRTIPQRLGRLEEEIKGLRQDVRSLRGLVERSMTDQGRFSTWMISCMTQLMEASGRTYQAFDGTFRGSYPETFERRTRQRTDGASTSIAQTSLADLAAKKSTMLVKYLQSGNLEVLES
ncbi:hypothetical protein Tco_1252970 [Tanacetum coccineum]